MQPTISTCFLFEFQMKIAAIDDDKDFLDLLPSKIRDNEIFSFTSPDGLFCALDPISINIKNFVHEDAHGINCLDYDSIKNFVDTNSQKHGIIISDQSMPLMSGLDLLVRYSESDIMKVLLTNVVSAIDGNKALNNKLIDNFITKSQLSELQSNFFKNTTRETLKSINTDGLPF